jgi:hypothetical protein
VCQCTGIGLSQPVDFPAEQNRSGRNIVYTRNGRKGNIQGMGMGEIFCIQGIEGKEIYKL